MPITIQPTTLKYKNGNSFTSADCIKGDDGKDNVYYGTETPTDPDVKVWVDPSGDSIIDDTAGSGATNKVWSADKSSDLQSAIQGKQDAPASGATAGKVLGLTEVSNELVPTWVNQPSVPVTDVQVNGTSVLSQGVANIPIADANTPGVARADYTLGVGIFNNAFSISNASDNEIKTASSTRRPINPASQHKAVFYGLASASGDTSQSSSSNAVGTYTESAKSSIAQMLDAPETVSGSTPSITAKAGVRYICGEVSTLTIVVPSSGIIDVTFESGSTATVLTVTPPTGVTAVKWVGNDDPSSLEANKTYEINILDGEFGVIASWT